MPIYLNKLKGITVYQDGEQLPGTGRVSGLNYQNQLLSYDPITGIVTVGPGTSDNRAEVHAATTAALAANTRSGNNLTANSNGALAAIDGVTLTTNQRVLVKDEASTLKNGWYFVADPGGASTPWILSRTADADVSAEFIAGAITKVLSGTVNGGKWFSLSVGGTFILNTDAVSFVEYFPQSTGFKDAVRVATTAALATNSRSGNVLTETANGALASIDGVSLSLNDRVLVKDEATGANNGIYRVTSLGSAGAPWTLTRAADLQVTAQALPNILVPVSEGTVNAEKLFQLTTNATITLNTTALTFSTLAVTAPGSTTQVLYNNAGSIDGASGITVVNSEGSLAFGATPATTGALRLTNGTSIAWWYPTGGVNIPALAVGSDGVVVLGDGTAAVEVDIKSSSNIDLMVGATLEYRFSATTLDCNQNSITDVGFIEVGSGTQPAQGLIRAPHGSGQIIIAAKNQAGSSDPTIITWGIGGNNWLIWGSTGAGTNIYNTGTGGSHTWWINDVTEMSLSATALDLADNNLTNVGDFDHDGANLGLFGVTPTTRQTITGSRGGNAAVADLLTKGALNGYWIDGTSA